MSSKLPVLVVFAYSLPSFTYASIALMVATYLPGFYADHVGVPLSAIAAISMSLQVFDAVTDPAMGILSDRCHSKYGRRRPFVIVGTLLTAASFVALFSPPQGASRSFSVCYAISCSLLLFLFLSAARVPWLAWGIELTSNYDEKTRVTTSRELAFVLGALVAAALPVVVERHVEDEFLRMSCIKLLWAVLMCLAAVCCFFVVPNTTQTQPVGNAGPAATTNRSTFNFLCNIYGNLSGVVLYLNWVPSFVGTQVNALMFAFFVKYVLEAEELLEYLLGTYIALGALFTPMWHYLSTKFEKCSIYVIAMVLQASAMTIAFFAVGSRDIGTYVICVSIGGLSFGGASALRYSIMGDIADFEQWRSGGFRDEGKLMGLFAVSSKLFSSGAIALSFLAVDSYGYKEGELSQSSATKLAIRICYALVPAVLCWMGIVVMVAFYPLNRARHMAVLEELASVGSTKSEGKQPNSDAPLTPTLESVAVAPPRSFADLDACDLDDCAVKPAFVGKAEQTTTQPSHETI